MAENNPETRPAEAWPTEIKLAKDRASLAIAFDDGARFVLSAELLRVESPSAEVQGHSPAEKVLVRGKAGVLIASVEPIGNYAVRLVFDDDHATGIYGWGYLRELGREAETLMGRYREALAASRG